MNTCPQASRVNQRSRLCNQQQGALNPPLSSPRVTPQLNTDAGVCTCVSIVISVMEGRGGGLRGEQREGGKLSSRVCSFAERCSTCSLIEARTSGLARSLL